MLQAIVERVEIFNPTTVHIVWKFKDEYALLETCAALGEVDDNE